MGPCREEWMDAMVWAAYILITCANGPGDRLGTVCTWVMVLDHGGILGLDAVRKWGSTLDMSKGQVNINPEGELSRWTGMPSSTQHGKYQGPVSKKRIW